MRKEGNKVFLRKLRNVEGIETHQWNVENKENGGGRFRGEKKRRKDTYTEGLVVDEVSNRVTNNNKN